MHTCAHKTDWILFTWELCRKARGRRQFYARLEHIIAELPPGSWFKLGGSVYIVERQHSGAFRELLQHFENPGLKWCELTVVVQSDTAHVCT